jgi:hypothetical protein
MFKIIVIFAIITSLGMAATNLNITFAEKTKDDSPSNTWGKFASKAGKDGEMGEHASNPGDLNPDKPGREGIGNVAKLVGDHPSDIPEALCGGSNDPICN